MGEKTERPSEQPREGTRAESEQRLDASQDLFYRDVAARVRRWIADGRPVRRKGA